MSPRLEELALRWESAGGPGAARMKPWAARMLEAARSSRSCGLDAQVDELLDRLERALPAEVEGPRRIAFDASWKSDSLPSGASPRREEELWRRVRALRAARRPYDGAQHPGRKGLAWGPYNRASAVIETLERAAAIDPLWVDDFIERERAAGAIEALLGIDG